jgi:hypothetical protein
VTYIFVNVTGHSSRATRCYPYWQHHEAGLNNIVYTTQQRVFLVRRFCQTASVMQVQCEFQEKFELGKAAGWSEINTFVNVL